MTCGAFTTVLSTIVHVSPLSVLRARPELVVITAMDAPIEVRVRDVEEEIAPARLRVIPEVQTCVRCQDKLERQIVRTKEKPGSVRKRHSDEIESVLSREALGTLEPDATGPQVVKTKRFAIEPMFEEDAIAAMEELGHQFFVFVNAETERIAILYARDDGDLGPRRLGLRRRRRRLSSVRMNQGAITPW